MSKKLLVSAVCFMAVALLCALPASAGISAKQAPAHAIEKPGLYGEYVVQVYRDGKWKEAGKLAYDKHLSEQGFCADLLSHFPAGRGFHREA